MANKVLRAKGDLESDTDVEDERENISNFIKLSSTAVIASLFIILVADPTGGVNARIQLEPDTMLSKTTWYLVGYSPFVDPSACRGRSTLWQDSIGMSLDV